MSRRVGLVIAVSAVIIVLAAGTFVVPRCSAVVLHNKLLSTLPSGTDIVPTTIERVGMPSSQVSRTTAHDLPVAVLGTVELDEEENGIRWIKTDLAAFVITPPVRIVDIDGDVLTWESTRAVALAMPRSNWDVFWMNNNQRRAYFTLLLEKSILTANSAIAIQMFEEQDITAMVILESDEVGGRVMLRIWHLSEGVVQPIVAHLERDRNLDTFALDLLGANVSDPSNE